MLKKLQKASVVLSIAALVFLVLTLERQMAVGRAKDVMENSYQKMQEAYNAGDEAAFQAGQNYVLMDAQTLAHTKTSRNLYALLFVFSLTMEGLLLWRVRRQ